MSKLDEMINKSLEDIDAIVTTAKSNLSKSEPVPDEVSQDTPESGTEEGTEEPTTEEGEEEPGEGDELPSEEGEGDNEEAVEDTEKSLESTLNGNDSVRKALEVSEFLSELVKGISTVIGAQGNTLAKSIASTDQATEFLAKSFDGIAKSQRVVLETQSELLKSVRILNKRIKTLEEQPTVRKSVSSSAQVLEKSFAGTPLKTNAGANTSGTALSKSEILTKLTTAFDGGNHALQNDILAYESLGDVKCLSGAAQALINAR
jgi:hypothetical protein